MADYVIVGAGSAGCVLAGRLSEDADASVLLLEAGGPDTAPEIHVPAMFPIMFKSSLDWDLLGEEEPGLGDRRLYLPRGRMIGGCSSINAMIYLRGNRLDYDDWAAGGATGWSYDEVLPYFKRGEDNERGEDAYPRRRRPADRLGQPLHAPARRPHARSGGAGRLHRQSRPERREPRRGRPLPAHATRRAALQYRRRLPASGGRPAEPRGAGSARSSSAWSSRADRAVGVEVVRDGSRETIRAEREVILAAGAYQSPVLLMLSGIGLAEELEPFGIAVREELPVGRNLQDHLMVNVNYLSSRACALRHLHARELRVCSTRKAAVRSPRTCPRPVASSGRGPTWPRPTSSSTSRRRSSTTRGSRRRTTTATSSARW